MSSRISQNAFWVVLCAILIGLFVTSISAALRPYTFNFLFIVMLCALMRLPQFKAEKTNGRKKAFTMGKLLFWQLILTPILVWVITKLTDLPTGISTALIACSCAGPVFSTPTFARLNKLDDGFTIQNLVISSLLMPVVLLTAGTLLLQHQPDIDVITFIKRVAFFLFLPFIIGYIFKKVIPKTTQQRLDMPLMAISTIALALMACSLMDGLLLRTINEPIKIIGLLIIVLLFNLGLQGFSTFLFRKSGSNTALNAGLVCGYRNWALTLAITAGSLGEDFTTLVAIGQFGVMLLPLPSLKYLKLFFKS